MDPNTRGFLVSFHILNSVCCIILTSIALGKYYLSDYYTIITKGYANENNVPFTSIRIRFVLSWLSLSWDFFSILWSGLRIPTSIVALVDLIFGIGFVAVSSMQGQYIPIADGILQCEGVDTVVSMESWDRYSYLRQLESGTSKLFSEHDVVAVFLFGYVTDVFPRGCKTICESVAIRTDKQHSSALNDETPNVQKKEEDVSSIMLTKAEAYLTLVVGIPHISKEIVKEFHYADLKSLMLVSRGVRYALACSLGPQVVQQVAGLEGQPATDNRCWCCDLKICEDCTRRAAFTGNYTHPHCCEPYCTSCFRKKLCYVVLEDLSSPGNLTDSGLPPTCSCPRNCTSCMMTPTPLKRRALTRSAHIYTSMEWFGFAVFVRRKRCNSVDTR
ncbi:hypothetical protein BDZ91DRAFT_763144 [Kalaharituber pfeilii]|nr:hypothetical protein BDZ91DRAFT_763144 [Kalaharituber pfeilii]